MRIALNVCKLKKIFNVIRKLSTESSNRASTIYALSSGIQKKNKILKNFKFHHNLLKVVF